MFCAYLITPHIQVVKIHRAGNLYIQFLYVNCTSIKTFEKVAASYCSLGSQEQEQMLSGSLASRSSVS